MLAQVKVFGPSGPDQRPDLDLSLTIYFLGTNLFEGRIICYDERKKDLE